MSNSTPRAALPPPRLYAHELIQNKGGVWLGCPSLEIVKQAHTPGETGEEILALYTAEQVEQIRRETVQACADLCAAEQAENRTLAKGSKTAMYDWMADGAGLCRGAILALLDPKE